MYPAVKALMCLRGFQLTAAAVLVAELGDVRRFAHPRHVMAFLGLVPKEATTGQRRRLGGITKAGNAHARWILIEAIQHAYHPPKVSAPLALRQSGQPPPRIANSPGRPRCDCTSEGGICCTAGS
jgi:transposase